LVGVYDHRSRLAYAGSVKRGFGRTPGLLKRLEALEEPESPFAAGDPPKKAREVHWARPDLVAAVELADWTSAGRLRLASFKGLREDKEAYTVRRETPGPEVL